MPTITLMGDPLHTYGDLPLAGNKAPNFTMTRSDMTEIRLSDCQDEQIILNIFPSLDTETCAAAMVRFDDIASKHPDLLVLCISADLPFAQKRFCVGKHLDNVVPVSIFRNTEFGKTYGVVMIDGPLAGLLSRAVVIINKQGIITYTQQVRKIEDEPEYEGVIKALATS